MSKNYRQKILFILGGTLYTLALLIVLTILLIPTAGKFAFSHWLQQQHLQGGIDDIDLSLKTGTLTIQDAVIRKNQDSLLKLGKFLVRIKLRNLIDHKLTIEQVTLANTNIQVAQQENALVLAGINLNQSADSAPPLSNQEKSQPWTIQLQQLHIANLDTCLTTSRTQPVLNVCNHLGNLTWHGNISMSTDNPTGLKSAGNISLSKLNIMVENKKLSLLRFDSLALTGLTINSLDQIKFDKLELQQFATLPNREKKAENAATLGLDKLQVNSVALTQLNDIDIADINIDDIATYIHVKTDNSIASLSELANYRPVETNHDKSEKKMAVKPPTQKPLRIRIGKIAVSTKKSLILEDDHTSPPTRHEINHFSFTLGTIDSSKPDQSSDLSMQFKYGKYGEAKVTGTVQPFAAKPTVNLHATILGLNLNRVSSYTKELLQHKIKSGQLDAKIVIKIDQGKLDSDAKLKLYKFYVDKLSEKEADKYQKSLGIPLSDALSLLRDKNDTISIDLPVTGNVEKPDFSLNDIIATVSAKAIKVAIINYYATLGLLKLVSGAVDLVTALRFDPLEFIPGQSGLTDTSRNALNKFATMLKNRPQVHLVVCGHATLADQLKLFPLKKPDSDTTTSTSNTKPVTLTEQQLQQLNKLALTRSDQVKQYLVEQKGVAAERLIGCNPEYKVGDEHSPYVELHI